jgi:hypothetical protein
MTTLVWVIIAIVVVAVIALVAVGAQQTQNRYAPQPLPDTVENYRFAHAVGQRSQTEQAVTVTR